MLTIRRGNDYIPQFCDVNTSSMENQPCLLVINCGSSGIKFAIFEVGSLKQLLKGSISEIGTPNSVMEVRCSSDKLPEQIARPIKNFEEGASVLVEWLSYRKVYYPIVAIGHRVVHGGPEYFEPVRLTAEILDHLKHYSSIAPLHLPNEIKVVERLQKEYTHVPQVLCFDTAFHKEMPAVSATYPVPQKYRNADLRKYGFHGISCEYVMRKLQRASVSVNKKNIIIAHLGSGCSLTAVSKGKSIDTTMGFSPTGGIVMSTRSGDMDPGAVLFLMRHFKMNSLQLDKLLSYESGLKGLAGKSDIQELLKSEDTDPASALAISIFCYAIRKNIAALTAAMGGLDALVFTGGIGEHSAVIRERICEGLGFLNLYIHPKRNTEARPRISKRKSKVAIRIIPTNEEVMIAIHTKEILNPINTQPNENATNT